MSNGEALQLEVTSGVSQVVRGMPAMTMQPDLFLRLSQVLVKVSRLCDLTAAEWSGLPYYLRGTPLTEVQTSGVAECMGKCRKRAFTGTLRSRPTLIIKLINHRQLALHQ